MDEAINCASCGVKMRFGQGYSSKFIHNPIGLAYSVCKTCYDKEWKLEIRYKPLKT